MEKWSVLLDFQTKKKKEKDFLGKEWKIYCEQTFMRVSENSKRAKRLAKKLSVSLQSFA